MFVKDNNNECCALYCSCGCDNGVVLRAEKDDDFGSYLTLVSDIFYLSRLSSWDRFKGKCKRVWKILRNKEHDYFNIYIRNEDLEEFKEFVSNM